MSFDLKAYEKEMEKKYGTCRQCGKGVQSCTDCYHYVCVACSVCNTCSDQSDSYFSYSYSKKLCRSHNRCLECGKKTVCHLKKICGPCDLPCHAITDTVSVGSCGAMYDDFDLIFNLNFPENGAEQYKIKYIYGSRPNGGWKPEPKKLYYNIGMYDESNKESLDVFREAIGVLKKVLEDQKESGKELKILFHCFAGYSRSVALASAYLALKQGIRVDEALELVRSKRKYIGPNQEFLKIAREEIE